MRRAGGRKQLGRGVKTLGWVRSGGGAGSLSSTPPPPQRREMGVARQGTKRVWSASGAMARQGYTCGHDDGGETPPYLPDRVRACGPFEGAGRWVGGGGTIPGGGTITPRRKRNLSAPRCPGRPRRQAAISVAPICTYSLTWHLHPVSAPVQPLC